MKLIRVNTKPVDFVHTWFRFLVGLGKILDGLTECITLGYLVGYFGTWAAKRLISREYRKEIKMKVFKTQLCDYGGPCVVHEPESVIDELRRLLPEMAEGESFTVTVVEMDEEEYGNLPEFLGY